MLEDIQKMDDNELMSFIRNPSQVTAAINEWVKTISPDEIGYSQDLRNNWFAIFCAELLRFVKDLQLGQNPVVPPTLSKYILEQTGKNVKTLILGVYMMGRRDAIELPIPEGEDE